MSREEIKNGDKVTYKEAFGAQELVFVGMANNLHPENDCVVTCDGLYYPVMYSELERVLSSRWTAIDYSPETFPLAGKHCLIAWNKNFRGESETFDELVTFDEGHPSYWMDTHGNDSYDFSDDMSLPTHWCYAPVFNGSES